jgi:diketogulonate reductase-like aldo/keto reductase
MTLTSSNGITVPSFMYGTAWKKDETARLAQLAVENGFQAIDTANQIVHYNEELVGRALQALAQNGIKRESLFLQTKFTSVDGQRGQTPYDAKAALTKQVNQSMDSSLLHLHTDYVDSYVLHGPYERYKLGAADWEVWTAIEALYNAGKARMIGISNVTAEQLEELCAGAKVKPMMVQNRCYAVMGWDHEVREICRQHGIIYQGFSLLTANANIIAESTIQSIARRLNTGVAQVIFRFAMQVGMLPLTGTSNAQHMKEDLTAEHLSLTDEETRLIATIGLQTRF